MRELTVVELRHVVGGYGLPTDTDEFDDPYGNILNNYDYWGSYFSDAQFANNYLDAIFGPSATDKTKKPTKDPVGEALDICRQTGQGVDFVQSETELDLGIFKKLPLVPKVSNKTTYVKCGPKK